MDVKSGSGAFMTALDDARDLADAIAETANRAGLPTVALVTDMNQVLGRTAGNALEVREAIGFLTGHERDPRLLDVTLALAGEMLVLGGLASGAESGVRAARAALEDRSEEHTSELQSLMRISYAVFCLKKKKHITED